MAIRIRVKQMREELGVSQEKLAERIWPESVGDKRLLALRARTIRTWENDGREPSPMAKAHLERILKEHRDGQRESGSHAKRKSYRNHEKNDSQTNSADRDAAPGVPFA